MWIVCYNIDFEFPIEISLQYLPQQKLYKNDYNLLGLWNINNNNILKKKFAIKRKNQILKFYEENNTTSPSPHDEFII